MKYLDFVDKDRKSNQDYLKSATRTTSIISLPYNTNKNISPSASLQVFSIFAIFHHNF